MFKKQIKVSHMSPRGAKKVQEFMVMERTITLTVGSHQKEFITTSTQRDDLVIGYLYLQGLDIEAKDIQWEANQATIAREIDKKRDPMSLGVGPQVEFSADNPRFELNGAVTAVSESFQNGFHFRQ